MERLRLFFYRDGEHFEYPADVREAYGAPRPAPLLRGRAEGWERVDTPAEADFLVFPYLLDPIICHRRTPFARRFLEQLPYFAELEQRHLFFNFHDLGQPLCTTACIVTDDPRRSNRDDPFVYAYPHFPLPHVLAAAPALDFAAIRFDVSFVGTLSDPVRLALLEGIEAEPRLRFYLNAPTDPEWDRHASYLHLKNERRKRALERLYVGVSRRSWAVLCPRGRGSSSIRFYETLCLGRLPVHVSDEYVPPLAERIDYGAFTLFLPEAEAGRAGALVYEWLRDKGPREREAMCRAARRAWEEHLAPEHAQEIALDILRAHKALRPGGPSRLVRMAPGALRAEPHRRVYPGGHFANMALDDGRSWFCGAMLPQPGPDPDSITINGVPGDLTRPQLNALYSLGRALPANACVVDLGGGAGLAAIVLANALLSVRDMNARVFSVDLWPEGGLEAFWRNARNAGVEFLLTPLRRGGREAAELFRDGAVDLLFVSAGCARGQGLVEFPRWLPRLRPGATVCVVCGADGEGLAAVRDLGERAGASCLPGPCQGLVRLVLPGG